MIDQHKLFHYNLLQLVILLRINNSFMDNLFNLKKYMKQICNYFFNSFKLYT